MIKHKHKHQLRLKYKVNVCIIVGSGVFAKKTFAFAAGSFLLEYEGTLIKNYKYACRLEKENEEAGLGSFMFLFRYKEKTMW